jgi:hypothetical protein
MPDVTLNYSQGMEDKIIAKHGTIAAYKQWVKRCTKDDIRNHMVNNAQIAANAALEAAIADADAAIGAL